MGEDCTPGEWARWAEAMHPGTYLLEKGEKVITRPPNPEQKARFEALIKSLNEQFGAKDNG